MSWSAVMVVRLATRSEMTSVEKVVVDLIAVEQGVGETGPDQPSVCSDGVVEGGRLKRASWRLHIRWTWR